MKRGKRTGLKHSGGLVSTTQFDQEMACNREVYERLKEQIRHDFAGQYVAIAFGKIIAISPNFDEAKTAVDRLQPAPAHCVVFPAEDEPHFEPVEDPYMELLE
jgi:hypothetical protein